jgi:mannosyl-oligosaccharide alpha-1,2-mannosidase
MEFTRMAQLTGDDRYYDAIARITDQLEEFQKETRIPGIWPTNVDASGCVKPDIQRVHSASNAPSWLKTEEDLKKSKKNSKRGVADEQPLDSDPNCIPQGLSSSNVYADEVFTIGGLADSTYEYLPKEHILIGGLNRQYEAMYKSSADAIIENLLYRPMLPDEDRYIVMTGRMNVPGYRPDQDPDDKLRNGYLDPEGAHLTCFAGAMFGLGAKLFEREKEMDLAKKLTDFCVWAYNSTTTGIMPESFRTLPCEDPEDCPWDEAFYYKALDPTADARQETYKSQLANYKKKLQDYKDEQVKKDREEDPEFDEDEDQEEDDALSGTKLRKRQLKLTGSKTTSSSDEDEDEEDEETLEIPEKGIYHPKKPMSHKDFVQKRIHEERIPAGMVTLDERKYILRPEAIESVFYMYRMTGEEYWREAGWNMFTSIISYTRTEFGHSSIDDVTKEVPTLMDGMEVSLHHLFPLVSYHRTFANSRSVFLARRDPEVFLSPLRR